MKFNTMAVVLSLLMLSACAQSSNNAGSGLPTSSGSDRLNWQSESVYIDRTNSTYSAGGSALSIAVPLTLTLVASLTPPVVNGAPVFATDVKMSGTKVYVAYNTVGSTYGGGVDVVDVVVPALPVLTSSFTDSHADFSQLMISGSSLYSVGAMDTLLADSAIVRKYSMTLGNISVAQAAAPLQQIISGPVGLGVVTDGVNIYAASGNGGGLTVMSPTDLSISNQISLDGVRDVRLSSGKINVLTGKTGSAEPLVKTYSTAGGLLATSAAMTGSVIDEGKATLAAGTILNLATDGQGGTNLICAATGVVANHISIPTVSGLTAAQSAANAAVFSGGLIFVANGGAGINVYALQQNDILPSCNVSTNLVGTINFGDGTSVNNLLVAGGYLIAATGAGGFKIVLINQGVVAGLLGAL